MDNNENLGGKYPWHLFLRTIVLINAYLVLGVSDGILGPTLLDLTDIIGISIDRISIMLIMKSAGSLFGCLLTGYLLDKFHKYLYFILSGTLILMTAPLAAFPYCNNIMSICFLAFFKGLGAGSVDTTGCYLILRIWEGRNSGPYMHSIQFSWGLGALLAPLIARPFLMKEHDSVVQTIENNGSKHHTEEVIRETFWTIKVLYPILAIFGIVVALGPLYYAFKDFGKETKINKTKNELEPEKKEELKKKNKIILTGIMAILYFIYDGFEISFGTFLSVFAVKSGLKLSRTEGSDITAIFYGTFAVTRGLAIALSVIATPSMVMWTSYGLCLLGSLLLTLFANYSSIFLYFGTAIMGIGMASIFGTGFLWMEQIMEINSKISAVLIISSAVGSKVFPVIIGQFVEYWPMMLHYFTFTAVSLSCLIFALANIFCKKYAADPC